MVDRFSKRAAPLSVLTGPRVVFHWGAREQASFNSLKCALSAAQVLRLWEQAHTTDAS